MLNDEEYIADLERTNQALTAECDALQEQLRMVDEGGKEALLRMAEQSQRDHDRAEQLWNALDRARREGGYSPHHCPGCDAATDETFYDEPAPHEAGCWIAEALSTTPCKAPSEGKRG